MLVRLPTGRVGGWGSLSQSNRGLRELWLAVDRQKIDDLSLGRGWRIGVIAETDGTLPRR